MRKLYRKSVFRQNFRGGVTQKVDLLLTDPPYGVDYVGKTGDAMTIENDGVDRDALLKLLTGSERAQRITSGVRAKRGMCSLRRLNSLDGRCASS